MEKRQIKVIHVHFIITKKNYYFGGVRAIFKKFSTEEIGCSEDYLRQKLCADGCHHITDKVLIIRSHLIR